MFWNLKLDQMTKTRKKMEIKDNNRKLICCRYVFSQYNPKIKAFFYVRVIYRRYFRWNNFCDKKCSVYTLKSSSIQLFFIEISYT